MANPVSTANLFGHPIHPMLIPFPIAFFVATFVCDLALWLTGNAIWVTAATWLLGGGLVMAALAALAGLTDFLGDARIAPLLQQSQRIAVQPHHTWFIALGVAKSQSAR